jgi:hypothetical protein
LQYYTDLQVQMGGTKTPLWFFLADLGDHKAILGYSWFAATHPQIDWRRGWIDHSQLPIILRVDNAKQAVFLPRNHNESRKPQKDQYYIGAVTIHPKNPRPQQPEEIPTEYQRHKKVFSKEQS